MPKRKYQESEGFFSLSMFSPAKSESTLPRCGLCGLYRTCNSPKMKASGKGKRKILVIAEAPGETEDARGVQLVGKAGQYTRGKMKNLGLSLDRDCLKTNAVICRPPGNVTPTSEMIASCRPTILKTIKKFKPRVIFLMGNPAIESVIPMVWKEEIGAGMRWRHWAIPCQKFNAWICPTYHPSYLLRKNNDMLDNFFYNDLKRAIKKSKHRPWKTVPSYKDEVEVILKTSAIVKAIKSIKLGIPFSWDLETNSLRPEEHGTKIISCSICQGSRTFAFPWKGSAIDAMATLLKSKTSKIGANIKYESRWILNKLGFTVKRWLWDTMLAAHCLDNRSSICSLKFQAFVHLGQESYDDHIKPYLELTSNKLNRIEELDIREVLVYNGIDSRVTYELAKIQMKLMKGMSK